MRSLALTSAKVTEGSNLTGWSVTVMILQILDHKGHLPQLLINKLRGQLVCLGRFS